MISKCQQVFISTNRKAELSSILLSFSPFTQSSRAVVCPALSVLCWNNVMTERNDLLLQSHHSTPAKNEEQVIFFLFFIITSLRPRHFMHVAY